MDLPSTSVSSSCEEKATQARRKKAANSKHLTSILVGTAQRPEGRAKGVLVALFIDHVSGSNITFTKKKKNTNLKQIHLLRNGSRENVLFRGKQPFIKHMV